MFYSFGSVTQNGDSNPPGGRKIHKKQGSHLWECFDVKTTLRSLLCVWKSDHFTELEEHITWQRRGVTSSGNSKKRHSHPAPSRCPLTTWLQRLRYLFPRLRRASAPGELQRPIELHGLCGANDESFRASCGWDYPPTFRC